MINFDYLDDLTDGDNAFMKVVLDSIIENLTEVVPQIRQAYRRQDCCELKNLAHKLKSSISYLHAETIDSLLDTIEGVRRKSDLETSKVKLALDNLELYHPILTKEIRAKIVTLN